MRVKTEISMYQPHCTLGKCILKCIFLKSDNISQTKLSQVLLLKKLPEMVIRSSQGTISLQPHTHPLGKLIN